MAGISEDYQALEQKLQARVSAAKHENKAQAKAALKALKKDAEDFFDKAISESGKSGIQSILRDAKQRTINKVEGKEERPDQDEAPEDADAEVLSEARHAMAWVVPKPVDPAVIASVIERDRAAAIKAGHPVGPLTKKVV